MQGFLNNSFLLRKVFRRLSLRESSGQSTRLSRSERRQSAQPTLPATGTNSPGWAAGILGIGSALFLLLAAGCGDGRPRRLPVSGRVLIDGKPLEVGFLQVMVKGNRPASGKLGPGGHFTLTTFDENDGCIEGNHPVAVIAGKSLNEKEFQWFAPKKYADSMTSGLKMEVTGPREDVELHLTWQGSGHDRPFVEKQ